MKKLLCLLLAWTLLLAGCAAPTGARDAAALRREVNAKNQAIPTPQTPPEAWLYDYPAALRAQPARRFNGTRRQAMALLSADGPQLEAVDVQTAEKEIELLSKALRRLYAGYGRNGGDEAFEAARDKALAAARRQGGMTLGQYKALLADAYSFVVDNHFLIGGITGRQEVEAALARMEAVSQNVLTLPGRDFYQKDGRYYADKACARPLAAVGGQAPETYVKYAIDEKGGLCLRLYASAWQEALPLELTYQDGTSETVTLEKTSAYLKMDLDGYLRPDAPAYTLDETKGWPEIYLREFSDTGPAARFQQDAASLAARADAPFLLCDLTANSGGSGFALADWFLNYTGRPMGGHALSVAPVPEGGMLDYTDDLGWDETVAGDYRLRRPPVGPLLDTGAPPLVVLTSRFSASCAEQFADAARCVRDTLVIGTWTNGCLTQGLNEWRLPYTGLHVRFGVSGNCFDEAYFAEQRGLEPDIFLTGENCRARLDAFLQHYLAVAAA